MKIKNCFIILVILIVAAVLRFYNFFHIPFTHDEFSALFRTHFNSFPELIEKGVKPDGHPAGVQVFLFYYSQLFGSTEWIIKLPFVISGIISVFLIFLVGKKWFGVTTGLVCAAFMATLEYPVMYSQIARPYGSGLMLCLFLVYFWHKVIFEPDRRFFLHLSLYIFFSICCAYNHYFSLLFAIIVGFTGLVFVKRKKLWWYIMSGIIIFLLFLPYFPVFIYQFHGRGVGGWLGAPGNDYLMVYIGYIFHFSWFIFLTILSIIVFGFVKRKEIQENNSRGKFLFISIAWFFLPFLIGFFYSKFVNPVLQESCLIFSFPFLLLAIFGYLGRNSEKVNLWMVSAILMVNVLSLIFERDYYSLFYNSTYQRIVENTSYSIKKYGEEHITSVIDSHKKISRYYIIKENLDSSFFWYDSFPSKGNFIEFLRHQKSEYLSYACISGDDRVVPFIIGDYYPYLIEQKNYYNGNYYLFSKKPEGTAVLKNYDHRFGFEKSSVCWTINNPGNIVGNVSYTGKYAYNMRPDMEFGPVYEEKLSNIINNKNDYIDVSCWCYSPDTLKDVNLVLTLKSGKKMLSWMASGMEAYRVDPHSQWFKNYYSIKLAGTETYPSNTLLNVYVWNLGKKNLFIDDFNISQRSGNPVLYGLFQKINYTPANLDFSACSK